MDLDELSKDVDIRVIDQRIGMGIGGMDTVVRILHRLTGLLVEVPRLTNSQFYDRYIGMQMIAAAITDPKFRGSGQ